MPRLSASPQVLETAWCQPAPPGDPGLTCMPPADTEIDWIAYMDQVKGYLKVGEQQAFISTADATSDPLPSSPLSRPLQCCDRLTGCSMHHPHSVARMLHSACQVWNAFSTLRHSSNRGPGQSCTSPCHTALAVSGLLDVGANGCIHKTTNLPSLADWMVPSSEAGDHAG